MKRLLRSSVLLCALLLACSSETVGMWPAAPVHFRTDVGGDPASSPVTPTEKEHGLADAYTKALASPGFVELPALVDEQAHFAFGAQNTHGRERVLKGHEDMFGAFDQRRFVTGRVWLTDSTHSLNSQALEWTMTGVQARAWMGVAPTGKPVVIKGLTLLWTTDDGIISELHVYFDEEVVRAQLGSGPLELQRLSLPSPEVGALQVFARSGAPEEAANVAIARGMIQALEDNKEAEFLSTLEDDVEVFTADRAEPVRGKAAAHDYFKAMRKSIRLLDTVIENAWGVRSFVVIEYAITGLQLAPLPRITFKEGRPLHTQYVDVAEIANGRIARIRRYSDPIAFASL